MTQRAWARQIPGDKLYALFRSTCGPGVVATQRFCPRTTTSRSGTSTKTLHASTSMHWETCNFSRTPSIARPAKAPCSLVGCPGGLSRPSPRSGLIWTGAPSSPETQAPDAEDNSVRRPWDPPATWCANLARVACVKRPSIKRMQDVMFLWRHISS